MPTKKNELIMTTPIMMTEDYWANSQLSIARYYGGCTIGKIDYRLVNKEGISVIELSDPDNKHYVGDNNKAIEPGEPADLVQVKWIPVYRKLGRDKFIKLLQDNPQITLAKAKKMMKELC